MYEIWGGDVWAACVGWGVLAEGGMVAGGVTCNYVTQLPMETERFVGEDWRVVDTWVV